MKKNIRAKSYHGAIPLSVSLDDPIAWKLLMLFEAASSKEGRIEDIAGKFGYTREHFYIIKKAFDANGSLGLTNKPSGPKSNYIRTDNIVKQIIRHRFLDPEASCEVIAQKMRQEGKKVSQRSVERTITEYGLEKKGYIRQIRLLRKLK